VQDWLLQSNRAKAWSQKVADTKPASGPLHHQTPPAQASKTPAKKLSFKEQREYDSLPALIEALEQEQAALNHALADGALYISDPKTAADKAARVAQIDDELLGAMERWEALSQRVPTT